MFNQSNANTTNSKQTIWTCFTDSQGKVYYHNSANNQILWDPQVYQNSLNTTQNNLWRKLTNEHGKVYYYNTLTKQSQWTKPEDFIDFEPASNGYNALNYVLTPYGYALVPPNVVYPNGLAGSSSSQISSSSTLGINTDLEEKLATAEIEQKPKLRLSSKVIFEFEQMLKDLAIKADSGWQEILPVIETDERYKKIRNLSERKIIFERWKKKKKAEEVEDIQFETKKQSLYDVLKEYKEINSKTRPKDIEKLLRDNKRFKAIDDERLRRRILQEFSRYLVKNEKKVKKKEKIDKMNQLEAFLHEKNISTESSVEKIFDYVKDEPFCLEIDKKDLFLVIEEYLEDFKLRRPEAALGLKDENYENNARIRNEFRDLLNELIKRSVFNTNTEFSKVYDIVKDEKRYICLEKQPNHPEEIYHNFCKGYKKIIARDKKVFEKLIKNEKIEIDHKKSIAENEKAIFKKNIDYLNNLKSVNRRVIISELIEEKKQSEKIEKKKLKLKFFGLLEQVRIGSRDEWAEIKPKIAKLPFFSDCEDLEEEEKAKLFYTFIQKTESCHEKRHFEEKQKTSSRYYDAFRNLVGGLWNPILQPISHLDGEVAKILLV